jgi:hypothetical protein
MSILSSHFLWWVLAVAVAVALLWWVRPTRPVLKSLWDSADPLSKWVQIIGIVIAGCWAYEVFFATQAPGLLQALGVSVDIDDPKPEPNPDGGCSIHERVNIENLSGSVVDVAYVHLLVWKVNRSDYLVGSNGFRVFDVAKVEQQPPLTE